MNEAVIISDLHLGAEVCQAKALTDFLGRIHHGLFPTQKLILNGDVFDSIDFRRLKKHHWKVLSLIRKLSDTVDIHWINGNHDGPSEIISHLLGVSVEDELILTSGGKQIIFLHGHIFDAFIERYPIMSAIADRCYRFLQWLDKSHTFAKFAKHRSKIFLRCTELIRNKAIEYAERKGCQAVCCGHTHKSEVDLSGPVAYFNSGCWTEKPCEYLTLNNGIIELHQFHDVPDNELTTMPKDSTSTKQLVPA